MVLFHDRRSGVLHDIGGPAGAGGGMVGWANTISDAKKGLATGPALDARPAGWGKIARPSSFTRPATARPSMNVLPGFMGQKVKSGPSFAGRALNAAARKVPLNIKRI